MSGWLSDCLAYAQVSAYVHMYACITIIIIVANQSSDQVMKKMRSLSWHLNVNRKEAQQFLKLFHQQQQETRAQISVIQG